MALHRVEQSWKSPWSIHHHLPRLTQSDRLKLVRDPVDDALSPPLFKDSIQDLPSEDEVSRVWVIDTQASILSPETFAFENTSDHPAHSAGSTHTIATNIQSKANETKRALVVYERRIDELEEQAQPYGYTLRIGSKAAFLLFLDRMPQIREAGLVLMENGNLRAIWKGDDGAHVGLQFISPESIQYVIFRRRRLGSSMSRVAGRDTIDGILQQLDVFDLRGMLSR